MTGPFEFLFWLFMIPMTIFMADPNSGGHPMEGQQENLPTPPVVDPNNLYQQMLDRINQLEQEALARSNTNPPLIPQYPPGMRREPKIAAPPAFKGNKAEAQEFILKCDTIFAVQPSTYHDDKTKLAFVINLLQGEAYQWVKPALLLPDGPNKPNWILTWEDFKVQFGKDFGDSDIKETSRQKLKSLRQTGAATSYATEFRRHSLYLSWGDEAFRQAYFDGLKEDVKDRLLTPNTFTSLDALMEESIKWDNLLFQRRRSIRPTSFVPRNQPIQHKTLKPWNKTPSTGTYAGYGNGPAPMEIDSVQPQPAHHHGPLTQKEKDHRRANNLCLYCGKAGHTVDNCFTKAKSSPRPQGNGRPQ
jgi:hypothetical protein